MLLNVPVAVSPLDHCQLGPLTAPSGSVRVAVTAVPTPGDAWESVTLPASSTLFTLIVTSTVSELLEGSVAVSVTTYDALSSKSMVAPVLTVIAPVLVFSAKSPLNAVMSVPSTE